jgi:hypothetical protein
LFDLNAWIQQLTWSLNFFEIYSTIQSYLWFWPPLILGVSVISAGTMHDLRWVKVPGTGPLWNPWDLNNFNAKSLINTTLNKSNYYIDIDEIPWFLN